MHIKYLIIAIMSVVIMTAVGFWVVPDYNRLKAAESEYHEQQNKLRQAKIENEMLEADCHALTYDDREIERVARNKFGWCRDKEKIYDFSDND